jgi:putative flippase GtrA
LGRHELARYLLVGMLNTCVGLGTIYAAIFFLNFSDLSANLSGYSVGVLLSFALNKSWTFAASGSAAPQFARFVLVLAVAYMANLATVVSLIKLLSVNHYLANGIGIVPYTVIGFLGSRYFAFRRINASA